MLRIERSSTDFGGRRRLGGLVAGALVLAVLAGGCSEVRSEQQGAGLEQESPATTIDSRAASGDNGPATTRQSTIETTEAPRPSSTTATAPPVSELSAEELAEQARASEAMEALVATLAESPDAERAGNILVRRILDLDMRTGSYLWYTWRSADGSGLELQGPEVNPWGPQPLADVVAPHIEIEDNTTRAFAYPVGGTSGSGLPAIDVTDVLVGSDPVTVPANEARLREVLAATRPSVVLRLLTRALTPGVANPAARAVAVEKLASLTTLSELRTDSLDREVLVFEVVRPTYFYLYVDASSGEVTQTGDGFTSIIYLESNWQTEIPSMPADTEWDLEGRVIGCVRSRTDTWTDHYRRVGGLDNTTSIELPEPEGREECANQLDDVLDLLEVAR
jgi:hypothetical protein